MKREPDDAQRSRSRERAALEAKRDEFSQLDEIIRSLADEERVRKSLQAPARGARSAEPARDEPLSVVHITTGELPDETSLPASRVPRAPAAVVMDSTEHAAALLQLLEARGCAPYVVDDGAAAASLAPTIACVANLATPAAWRRVAAVCAVAVSLGVVKRNRLIQLFPGRGQLSKQERRTPERRVRLDEETRISHPLSKAEKLIGQLARRLELRSDQAKRKQSK
jgi:hypothetical protein